MDLENREYGQQFMTFNARTLTALFPQGEPGCDRAILSLIQQCVDNYRWLALYWAKGESA